MRVRVRQLTFSLRAGPGNPCLDAPIDVVICCDDHAVVDQPILQCAFFRNASGTARHTVAR